MIFNKQRKRAYRPEVKDLNRDAVTPNDSSKITYQLTDKFVNANTQGNWCPATMTSGIFNKWWCLGYEFNKASGENYMFNTTTFDTDAHALSAAQTFFYPSIPAGYTEHSRLGRQIQVIKDKWKFKFFIPAVCSFPYADPTSGKLTGANTLQGAGTYIYWNYGASQRRFRIRFVALFFPDVPDGGHVCQDPADVFHHIRSGSYKEGKLEAHFDTDRVRGFKVVYDKTKVFTMNPLTTSTPAAAGPAMTTGLPMEAYFTVKFPKHVKEWADANDGQSDTSMLASSADDVGLIKGGYAFYMYCEDIFASVNISASMPAYSAGGVVTNSTTQWAATVSDSAHYKSPNYVHPYGGISFQCSHDLKWIDP